jgi:hypothetical protein
LPPSNLRSRATFVDHVRIGASGREDGDLPVTNIVLTPQGPEDAWIGDATGRIGDWRSLTRSVYLRWALTINACEVAEHRYHSLPEDQALRVDALRIIGGAPERAALAIWPSRDAAARYSQITPLIAAYGIADLFGALEDVIFDLYEIALRHNPTPLISGERYRDLRRLWRGRSDSPEAEDQWQAAWGARLEEWRHRRAFDGLHRVLQGFFTHAGLQRPSTYHQTDIPDWCRTLEMIGELRHHVVHGAAVVSEKLGRLSNTTTSLTFDFVEGSPLDVKLHHLQSVECFSDQLLTAINLSLVEKAMGPIPRHE